MANPKEASLEEQIDVRSPVSFAPRRIGHMNIFVRELDRSMAFYSKICGLEEVGLGKETGVGFLSNGNTHHDVGCLVATGKGLVAHDGHVQVPKSRGHSPGLNHIGWEMESERHLVEAYKRASEVGLKIHRTVDHSISHSVYIFDPDGNLHEMYADVIRDWRNFFQSEGLEGLTTGWAPGEEIPSSEIKYDAAPAFRRVPTAYFHAVRLVRGTLTVRNFARMRNFFISVMGLKPLHESSNPASISLGGTAGGIDITLIERTGNEPFGLHHFSFQVVDEAGLVESEQSFRRDKGDVELCLDLPYKKSVFLRDPDGMRVELFNERSTGSYDANKLNPDLRSFAY